MTGPLPIRVLLADDHPLFRKGIASLLREERDFEVVGEAANGREALEKSRDLMPDIVLMDLSMPEMDGLEATRRIKQEMPHVRIVILTIEEEDQSLFEAVKNGAQGYVLKKIEPQALFSTLRGVAQGEASISRLMAAKLMGEFSRQVNHAASAEGRRQELSPRERGILDLVAQGKTNKEIASVLAIAENTVKNHLKNILEKLHLENRVQAATYALRKGLVGKPPKKND
jgi:two-component system nitrate/nitrite response regulator NarL